MGERPDEHQLSAWRAFLHAHATVVERLDHELQEEQNLPLTWYEVLLHLSSARDDRLRLSELASCLLLSRSGITRLMDRMVDAGLVERQPCVTDRRGAFAVLSPGGLDRLRKAAPVHLRGVQQHFAAHLDAGEIEAIRSGLEKVAAGGRRLGPTC